MWQDLLTALALMLVLEGILPFLNPSEFRKTLRVMAEFDDRGMRMLGLVSMVIGLALLYWVR